jgi:type 1 glutamine amidotransferase
MYGKGRVYYNSLGHDVTAWDIPAVQKMYFEAIKWALGLTDATIQPHPLVQVDGSPERLK